MLMRHHRERTPPALRWSPRGMIKLVNRLTEGLSELAMQDSSIGDPRRKGVHEGVLIERSFR